MTLPGLLFPMFVLLNCCDGGYSGGYLRCCCDLYDLFGCEPVVNYLIEQERDECEDVVVGFDCDDDWLE